MNWNFLLGCIAGFIVAAFVLLIVIALCHASAAADEHIEHEPLVTIVDGGTVIGRAQILHRKGKYLTVRYEDGSVGTVDTDYVEAIEEWSE